MKHAPLAVLSGAALLTIVPLGALRAQDAKPAGTGVAAGRVVLDGPRLEPKKIEIDPAKAKGCVPEGEAFDARDLSLLIDDKGNIQNVVVTIEVAGAVPVVPVKPIELDQAKCVFEPHVMLVPAGATVEFLNSDKISHNVHIYPAKNEPFNQTVVPGAKHTAKLEKADKINVKCDLHPWMSSWLFVVDTPFAAITGPDGSFKIEGLPPGEHKVSLWHESLGKASAMLTVAADGSAAPLEIRMAAQKKRPR